MKIEEIRKACFAGKTFTFNNVKIHEFDMSDGVFNIIYSLPSVENQPYCQGFDVKEISVYEPAKYDPCRLFKKGDVVKIRSVFGRKIYIDDVLYEVVWDESCNKISIKKLTSDETLVGMSSVFFELVTPVEELEPYFVMELKGGYGVYNTRFQPETEACHYWNEMHPHAKEAAEAECARLNAEHRKEQNN